MFYHSENRMKLKWNISIVCLLAMIWDNICDNDSKYKFKEYNILYIYNDS